MRHTLIHKLLTTVGVSVALAGCSSLPSEDDQVDLSKVSDEQISDWERIPDMTYRSHRASLDVLKPGALPARVYNLPLSLDLNGPITVGEFADYLQSQDLSVAIASDEISNQSIPLPNYEGTVGGLLATVADMTGLSFSWKGQSLLIDQTGKYIVRVPQNEELLTRTQEALGELGAEGVVSSESAGLLSYRASQSDQKTIEAYLDQLSVNAALINLQVAVVNVSLDTESNSGLDWSSLRLEAGDIGMDAETPQGGADVVGSLTGTTFGFVADGTDVSLEGVVNLLSQYGESKTSQNLTLKTLSGIPVDLRSGETIPFVEDIDLTTTSGSDTTVGGVDTSEIETGFDIAISPFFDAANEIITVDLEMSLKSLIGFRELVGESGAGSIRQPETQDQELSSIVQMEAGETVLLGGLVYYSTSDNRTTLTGLEDAPSGSKSYTDSRNALFILLRPTVTVYGPDNRREERQ